MTLQLRTYCPAGSASLARPAFAYSAKALSDSAVSASKNGTVFPNYSLYLQPYFKET
ncbi:MAG: hypothetical protein IPG08_18055 [Sphingobacteriaceae bacterium]|nr:hypothetical protein [Sphingobacteriaceae bacterium]